MNNDKEQEYEYDEEFDEKSKTRVKKEMHELRVLGEKLVELKPAQLATIPVDGALLKAIQEAPNVTQRSARKRHFQFIGKLMRAADHEAINSAYEKIFEDQHKTVRQHHLIENWRDQLMAGENQALENFIESFPNCDRQHLRQLIRGAQKEAEDNAKRTELKPPVIARKLFKYIRDCLQ
jgi:Uncharacterized protein conserved in bacteria